MTCRALIGRAYRRPIPDKPDRTPLVLAIVMVENASGRMVPYNPDTL